MKGKLSEQILHTKIEEKEKKNYPKCSFCPKQCVKKLKRKKVSRLITETIEKPKQHLHYGTPKYYYYMCPNSHLNKGELIKVIWKSCVVCDEYKNRTAKSKIPVFRHKRLSSLEMWEENRSDYFYNSYIPRETTSVLSYPDISESERDPEISPVDSPQHKRSLTPDYCRIERVSKGTQTPGRLRQKRVTFADRPRDVSGNKDKIAYN